MFSILKYIPMPVLYGVFLYMGISSLNGIQMFDRLLLFLMPKKYQPDYSYLRLISQVDSGQLQIDRYLEKYIFFAMTKLIYFFLMLVSQKDGQINGQMYDQMIDGQIDRLIDSWIDRWIDRWVHRWIDKWIDRQINKWIYIDGQINGQIDGQIDGQIYGRIARQMDRKMDRLMDRWMDRQMDR